MWVMCVWVCVCVYIYLLPNWYSGSCIHEYSNQKHKEHSFFSHLHQYWLFSSVQFNSVSQSCLTLCDPMNCSPTDFSIHRILQAKILEWEVFLCSRESSRFRDRIQISCNAGGLSNHLSHQGSPIQNQPRIANQSLQVLSSQRNKTSLKGKGQLGGL